MSRYADRRYARLRKDGLAKAGPLGLTNVHSTCDQAYWRGWRMRCEANSQQPPTRASLTWKKSTRGARVDQGRRHRRAVAARTPTYVSFQDVCEQRQQWWMLAADSGQSMKRSKGSGLIWSVLFWSALCLHWRRADGNGLEGSKRAISLLTRPRNRPQRGHGGLSWCGCAHETRTTNHEPPPGHAQHPTRTYSALDTEH